MNSSVLYFKNEKTFLVVYSMKAVTSIELRELTKEQANHPSGDDVAVFQAKSAVHF